MTLPMSEPTPYWSGEVMVLNWSETSTRGRTITLLLPEDEEQHPFRDLTVKSGKRGGQRMVAVFVLLTDDDQPAAPRLSQQAAVLCRDRSFWEWVSSREWEQITSEEEAKQYIYKATGIESRAQLDTDDRAAHLFRLIEGQFRNARVVFGRHEPPKESP